MVFGGRISYAIDVADDVDTFNIKVPALLLQPLVENAVKYGTRGDHYCEIYIHVRYDHDYICCSITDNGLDANPVVHAPEHVSKGIDITRKKLEMMFARYKNKPGILLAPNTGGGYTSTIKIPVR